MRGSSDGRAASAWLLAAALAAGALTWWLLGGGDPRAAGPAPLLAAPHADDRPPAVLPPSREAQVTEADAGAAVPAAAEDAGDDAAGAARAVLSGRITRSADGTPAAGVPVYALVQIDGERTPPPLDEAASRSVTDADGRYRLAYTRACTIEQLRARPGPDTVRAQRDAGLPLALGTEASLDLAVGSGGTISGLVVDASGRPVPGARVTGLADWATHTFENNYEPDRTTVTDGAGVFVLRGIGSPFQIFASAPDLTVKFGLVGTLAEGARLGLQAGGERIDPPLTVVMSRARTIRGQVLGTGGAPVVNAHLSGRLPELTVQERLTAVPDVFHQGVTLSDRRTGKDGRFEITPLGSEPCEIRVWSNDYIEWKGTHAPGDPDLLIHLDAGLVLTGVVTAAETGAVVAGANLFVHYPTADKQGTATRGGFSGEDGRFTITGLHPVTGAILGVEPDGYAIFVQQGLQIAASGPTDVRVALEPARALAGLVVDEQGVPVPDAPVTIVGDRALAPDAGMFLLRTTWEAYFDRGATTTDAQGRFRIDQLYDGAFTIAASSPRDGELSARVQVRSGSEDLRLALARAADEGVTLVGTALDALTGRPVRSFEVSPLAQVREGFTGENHHFESEDGSFRITGLRPGPLMVMAQAPGYATLNVGPRQCEAGEQRLDLRFAAERSVTLRVLDAARRPVACRLRFRGAGGEELMVEAGQGNRTSELETDARGEAQVHGLPATPLVVTVRRDAHSPGQDFPLDLGVEPRGPVELILQGGAQATITWLVLCGPGGADLSLPALRDQVTAGQLWPLDSDGVVRATDASGAVLAEVRVEAGGSDEELAMSRSIAPAAVRRVIGQIVAPNAPLVLSVEAAGYASASRAIVPAIDGTGSPVVLLLRRP